MRFESQSPWGLLNAQILQYMERFELMESIETANGQLFAQRLAHGRLEV